MFRTRRVLAGALLSGLALLTGAGAAVADDPSPSPSASGDGSGPTEAGTTFRTATAIRPDQLATAGASTGDYLYWVFPADAGQRATVKAKITLPETATRHGASTWQVDVYDGLRRRQACMYGKQTGKAAADAATVELTCVLRTVRAWSEPWANDPLPGSYYVRLTVVDLPSADLGLPVRTEVEVTADGRGRRGCRRHALRAAGSRRVLGRAGGRRVVGRPGRPRGRAGGRLVLRLVDRPLAVDGRRRRTGRDRSRLRLLADARQRPPVQGPAGRLTTRTPGRPGIRPARRTVRCS